MKKQELKKQLLQIGINVKGNYIRKSDIEKITKIIADHSKFQIEIEYESEADDDWDSLLKAIKTIKGVKNVKALTIDGMDVQMDKWAKG